MNLHLNAAAAIVSLTPQADFINLLPIIIQEYLNAASGLSIRMEQVHLPFTFQTNWFG
jgi:hypothetical protein